MKYLFSKILKINRGRYVLSSSGYHKYAHIHILNRENFHKNIIVIMGILSCKMKHLCFGIFTSIYWHSYTILRKETSAHKLHVNEHSMNFDSVCYWSLRLLTLLFSSVTKDKSKLRMWTWGKIEKHRTNSSLPVQVCSRNSIAFNIWHPKFKYLLFSR